MSALVVVGDARALPLADESVQSVVTSVPYFRQRDYGVAGQIGLEDSLASYVEALVGCFREVRRVLRRDGAVWLNVDDTYAGNPGNGRGGEGVRRGSPLSGGVPHRSGRPTSGLGVARKNLLLIPQRLAIALQADGWFIRLDGIWEKPNALPEPARDRPGRSHEYLYLMTRSARYYWNGDAIRELTGRESTAEEYAAGYGTNTGRGRGPARAGLPQALARTDPPARARQALGLADLDAAVQGRPLRDLPGEARRAVRARDVQAGRRGPRPVRRLGPHPDRRRAPRPARGRRRAEDRLRRDGDRPRRGRARAARPARPRRHVMGAARIA
jgi:site-specific DNA-methyltransferase (cytosine-N4-specific)